MAIPTPTEFAKYKKPEMVKTITNLVAGLKTTRNKADLITRYNEWYKQNAPAGPADEVSASVSAQAEEVDASESEPVNKPQSMLACLLKPDGTAVSAITLECIKQLRYTPGNNSVLKPVEEDLSNVLGSFKDFTTVLVRAISEVDVVTGHGENFVQLMNQVQSILGVIPNAPKILAAYYERWGLHVLRIGSRHNTPPRYEPEFQTQMAMAIQASLVTHNTTGSDDEDETDKVLEDSVSEELDILNSAVEHRLTRWSKSFPQKNPEDRLWSSDFSREELKQFRKYVTAYFDESDSLWEPRLAQEDQVMPVEELHRNAPAGISASVIQAVFLDIRTKRIGYHRLSESTASSRTSPPAKGSASPEKRSSPLQTWKRTHADLEDEDDEDESNEDEEGPISHTKRPRIACGRGRGRGQSRAGSRGRARSSVRGRSSGGASKPHMTIVETVQPTDEEDE